MLFQRLIAAAAFVLVSLAGSSAQGLPSQGRQSRPQQGTAAPRVRQLPMPRVSLSVSSASTVPGRPVTFVAQLSSGYPTIRYHFAFGDGSETGWQTSAVATHSYRTAGTYLAFVDISIGGGAAIGGSVRRAVQVSAAPVGSVGLVAPATVQPGRAVSVAARASSNDPQLRYRFVFGDGSSGTGWQASPNATHTYRKAGTYAAQVDVGRMTDRGFNTVSSARQFLHVSATPVAVASNTAVRERPVISEKTKVVVKSTPAPTPPRTSTKSTPTRLPNNSSIAPTNATPPEPVAVNTADPGRRGFGIFAGNFESDWWKYLLLGLLLAFVAYRLIKWASAPKTSIRGVADAGTASVKEEPAIASQVAMRQGVSDARYFVRADEAGIVKSLRKENV
jgi:PKD repeat protein